MTLKRKLKRIVYSILVPTYITISGCASYQPMPLTEQESPIDINALVQQAQKSPLLKSGSITLNNGLNLDELANLALFNSPLLKVNQQQYSVNKANAYNLGLLPDPQLSASFDHPTGNVLNTVNAWTGGIGYDLNALITHQSYLEVEDQQIKQAKLTLLWQAWQIKLQAKLLSVDLYYTAQKISLMQSMIARLEQRYQQSQSGIAEGNVTLETNGADLSILLDAYSQLKVVQQQYNGSSHQLAQLLGIQSLVGLTITPLSTPNELSKDKLSADLMNIAQKRPDLLALQSGYQAQEASVRAAILAQFPSFNLGITTAKDTSGLHTQGLNIGITLPLFNGNKGNILVARATRKQLAEEYQLRLLQTRSEVDELWQFNELINQQQVQLSLHLPTLQKLVESANKAYANGDIAALPFITMESTWFNKQLEQLDLQQSKWRTQLSLTLLLMNNSAMADQQLDENKLIYLH
jgi:outer membrane protein TolC